MAEMKVHITQEDIEQSISYDISPLEMALVRLGFDNITPEFDLVHAESEGITNTWSLCAEGRRIMEIDYEGDVPQPTVVTLSSYINPASDRDRIAKLESDVAIHLSVLHALIEERKTDRANSSLGAAIAFLLTGAAAFAISSDLVGLSVSFGLLAAGVHSAIRWVRTK